MFHTTAQPADDLQLGMSAMARGDVVTAAECFRRATARPNPPVNAWMGLAVASQRNGDIETMSSACDEVLKVEAGNLWALVLKGDYHTHRQDPRAAMSFYNLAIRLSEQYPSLPPDLAREVERARAQQQQHTDALLGHLLGELEEAGYEAGQSSERFTHSLDLLTGKRQPYVQQPRAHLFPGLPQIQFYPREDFAWMDAVEAATPDILAELQAFLTTDEARFEPYIQQDNNRPTNHQMALLDSTDWGSCFLVKDGTPVEGVIERFPATMAALKDVPLAQIKGRTPSILFSQLKPGAKILPHHGFINSRLICHLPLIVPPGCGFRVGNDTREWEVGKCWAFDDSIEHEAWNGGDTTRFVLIFDIWRPELTAEERTLVARLLEAVDTFSNGERQSWSD